VRHLHRASDRNHFPPFARLRGAAEKNTPPRGIISAPSCELKTCTPATCSAWASGHFSAQTVVAILLLVVGVMPTDNRDAGKFAADTTQLPTSCQPESLAKPARRRSHKPQRGYRRPKKSPAPGAGGAFSISDIGGVLLCKVSSQSKVPWATWPGPDAAIGIDIGLPRLVLWLRVTNGRARCCPAGDISRHSRDKRDRKRRHLLR
jgi:hypothetical protein